MSSHRVLSFGLSVVCAGLVAAGCGSSGSSSSRPSAAPGTRPAGTPGSTQGGGSSSGPASSGGGALVPEAQATAAGDIPDNQVFLVFRDKAAGYSIKYPEGWALSGAHGAETIRDKNNLMRISVNSGPAPTVASVAAEMASLRASQPSLRAATPQGHPTCTFQSSTRTVSDATVRVDYSTQSAPNPVTGKRVTLVVDRYYLAHGWQGRGRRSRHAAGRRQRRRLPADDRELPVEVSEPLPRARAARGSPFGALEFHDVFKIFRSGRRRDGRAARPRPARRAARARRAVRPVGLRQEHGCTWRPGSTSRRPARCARSAGRSPGSTRRELAATARHESRSSSRAATCGRC